jgi:anaerobic carbon-monoxide dehydrogenase catalytic subunit
MPKDLSFADRATQEMLKKAVREQIETVWDRYEMMQPQCGFGSLGVCCKVCTMGPCRLDPFGDGPQTGVCGANVDTIAARNIARMVAGGTAAHSDHGRDVTHTLLMIATNPKADYGIKNERKLKEIAEVYGVKTDGRDLKEIAGDVARAALGEFGQQEGYIRIANTAPAPRVKLWKEFGIMPRSVDREVVEVMHRTTMGVDSDYKNIMKHSMRTALADGWGGSMIATELQDVMFGIPNPLRSSANLGVIDPEYVNVIVHGHEPTLSDIIAVVSMDKKLIEKAKAKGAKGINVGGICCTANEILMRHGIPVVGTFLQQELALLTGAVEEMIVDVQCLMPSLNKVAGCFHTKLVTTSPKAKMDGVQHIEFHEDHAVEIATKILEQAIDNFPNRQKDRVFIPDAKEGLIAGFTTESVFQFLGGTYRSTYRPLNDAVMGGRLRGAAGVIGCSNPNVSYEEGHISMVKELIKNDVLVVTTGCNAISCAKHGLLQPEAALKHAGKGLQEICRAVGIPPVLHLGACVDNSRILRILANVVSEGGLGQDISDLPVAGAAPEWMSEKAVAIGMYFVASGVYTMIGHPLPMMGSKNLHNYLTDEVEKDVGGKWAFEIDPVEASHKMIRHIDKKRKALKLKPMMYEQAFKPEE